MGIMPAIRKLGAIKRSFINNYIKARDIKFNLYFARYFIIALLPIKG